MRGASATHASTEISQPGKASVSNPPVSSASERWRIGTMPAWSRMTRPDARSSSAITGVCSGVSLEDRLGHVRAAHEGTGEHGVEAERLAVGAVVFEPLGSDVFGDGQVATRRLKVLADRHGAHARV